MTARFHLTVPTTTTETAILPGFITDLRPAARRREPLSAARAAELSGLDGVAVPFDPDGLESLVTGAGLLRASRRLQVTAEFHPAIASPVYAAKLSASVQRFSANRLAWRLLVDLDPATARAHGDFLPAADSPGADRYLRAEEFLTVAKGVWSARDYTYEGRFYQVLGGGLPESRSAPAFPRVYLSGTSPEALALSAAHADVHVFTAADDLGLAPAGVAAGLVLPVLAREDEQEAVLAAKQTGFAGLAGSFAEVAKTLSVLIDRGVSEFFLAPPDPVADGYLLGQHVLPLLRREQDDELRETGKEQAHVG
jgi:alkanesulfonate monooxygenase